MTFWREFAYLAISVIALFMLLLAFCECVLAARADEAWENARETNQ